LKLFYGVTGFLFQVLSFMFHASGSMLQFIVARVVLCYGTGKRALYQSNSPLVFYARNISQFLRFALRDVKAIKWLSSQRAACRQPEYEWFVCQSEHERQLLVVHGVCGECLEPEPELGADGCEPERQRSGQRLLCPLPKGLIRLFDYLTISADFFWNHD